MNCNNAMVLTWIETPSEDGALRMATAGGEFKPAPFDGSGIPEDPPQHVFDRQFAPGRAHNGIVYTPPKVSTGC